MSETSKRVLAGLDDNWQHPNRDDFTLASEVEALEQWRDEYLKRAQENWQMLQASERRLDHALAERDAALARIAELEDALHTLKHTRDAKHMREMDAIAEALGFRDGQTYCPADLPGEIAKLRKQRSDYLRALEQEQDEHTCPRCGEDVQVSRDAALECAIGERDAALEELADLQAAVRALAPDCGDTSCKFATARGGMRTNGGCRCVDIVPSDKRRAAEAALRKALEGGGDE